MYENYQMLKYYRLMITYKLNYKVISYFKREWIEIGVIEIVRWKANNHKEYLKLIYLIIKNKWGKCKTQVYKSNLLLSIHVIHQEKHK